MDHEKGYKLDGSPLAAPHIHITRSYLLNIKFNILFNDVHHLITLLMKNALVYNIK